MVLNPRSFQPLALELETRRLLSVTTAPTPETADVTILSERSGTTPATAITNAVKGHYSAAGDNRAADAPLHVKLNGKGLVDSLGKANLSGSLDLGGYRVANSPDVSGTLTLSNAKGTVKILVTGSGGFDDVPGGKFVTTVSVVKGTGAYQGFQRTGTVTFDFGANHTTSHKSPGPIGGSLTVTLSLKPLVK